MKIKLKILLIVLFSFIFFSCEEDNDDETLTYKPWNDKIYNGINQINGIDIFDLPLDSSTSINLDDYCCLSDLPNGSFTTIRLKMWIPFHKDENYLSGIETLSTNRIVISYNGGEITEDIFQSGSITGLGRIEDPNDVSKTLTGISVDAVIPSKYNITKDNFEYVYFPFYLIYKTQEGEEVHRSERSYTLLNSYCN